MVIMDLEILISVVLRVVNVQWAICGRRGHLNLELEQSNDRTKNVAKQVSSVLWHSILPSAGKPFLAV